MQTHLPCPEKAVKRRSTTILRILTAAFCLFLTLSIQAQVSPLNRKITLRLKNVPLEEALDAIGDKAGFSFSYNPDLLRTDSMVTVQARRDQVKEVLESILGKRMVYRPIGNHLVIRRRIEAPLPYSPPDEYQLEGFLIDGESGDPVHFATVFENYKRNSVLTDGKGHYQIVVPGEARQVALSFSKRGFRDTVVVVRPDRATSITVGLMPIPGWDQPVASRPVSLVGDSDDDLPFVEFLVPEEQRTMADNILSALRSFPFQISLVPSIGTNRLLSGGMNNNFSLNILGGYANGVKGVEIGGLFNIDRNDVTGLQVGGLTNVVGGNLKGMQAGGLFNHVRGSVTGVQVGGLYNLVSDTVYGVQVGGLFNQTKGKVTGFQVGGIYNVAMQGVDGGQVAGISNVCKGDIRAMQIGGIMNTAENVGIFQAAGITNRAKGDVQGFQVAGISNHAKGRVSGFQVSGIINKARRVDGIQVGLINIADTVGGMQVGLLNFSKTGYTSFELSTNEIMQANLAYRAGNRFFYSILTGGIRLNEGSRGFGFGAGFGTLHDIGRLTLSLEATCNQIIEESVDVDRLNLVIPTRVSLGVKLSNALELYGGASLNLHVSNGYNHSTEQFTSELGPKPFWKDDNGSTLVQSWVGYQAGLRVNLNSGFDSEKREKKKDEKEPKEKKEKDKKKKVRW